MERRPGLLDGVSVFLSLNPRLDVLVRMRYNVSSERHEGLVDKPLTTQEAAAELGYSVRHLYRLLDDGTIQGERFGHVWMIDRQEVERIKALQGPGGRLPKEPKQS
jgi:excisionase family DNA binding protein